MTEIWNLSTLCRCCHRDGSFKCLNMPYQSENGDEMYDVLLRDTLGVNITQPPEHLQASYTICDECIRRLKDASQFRQQVLVCEEKFKIYCTNEQFLNEDITDDCNTKQVVTFQNDGFDDNDRFNDNDDNIHQDYNNIHEDEPSVQVKQDITKKIDVNPIETAETDQTKINKGHLNIKKEKNVRKRRIPSVKWREKKIQVKEDLLKYSSNYDDNDPEARRAKIIFLHKQGHSSRNIAATLNMARATVKLWIKRHTEAGDLSDHRRNNHGVRRVTPEQRTSMWQHYEESGLTDTRHFSNQFNVCIQTIRNHLRSMGLHHRNTKKIVLTDRHKADRLNFAHYYLNFDWTNVIFSDEKSFFSDDSGRLHLRSEDLYVTKNSKNSTKNISVNLWGWMSLAGVGELADIPLRSNSKDYICVLEEVMLPTVRIIYPENEVPNVYFIQDNCPVHTSKIVAIWLKEHKNVVNVIYWPANSPDLNPMEDLFGLMCQMWENKKDKTKESLVEHCHKTWELLRASNICSGLVGSMHTRLQDVIANGGGYTRF